MAALIFIIVLTLLFSAIFCWCMCAAAGRADEAEEQAWESRKINSQKEKE